MSLILGIDPGASGAAALISVSPLRVVQLLDFAPYRVSEDWREGPLFAALVSGGFNLASLAVIEAVSAMPAVQQGVSSAFAFGTAYGLARGLCAGLSIARVQLPRPAVWKGALGVPASKPLAVQRAAKEFPAAAHLFRGPRGGLMDGRAEACLLALFGLRFISVTPKKIMLDLLGHAR